MPCWNRGKLAGDNRFAIQILELYGPLYVHTKSGPIFLLMDVSVHTVCHASTLSSLLLFVTSPQFRSTSGFSDWQTYRLDRRSVRLYCSGGMLNSLDFCTILPVHGQLGNL